MSTDVMSQAKRTETENPADPNSESIATLDARIEALELRSKKLSTARVILFLAVLLGLFGSAESSMFPLGVALPALVAFIVVLFRHGAVLDAKKALELHRLLRFEKQQRRTDRRLSKTVPELRPSGTALERGLATYRPEPAAYALDEGVVDDLNVLSGPRNLFSVLSVTSTAFGARRLRHLLTHVLESRDEIRSRQEAVSELGRRTRLRESILESLVALREASFEGIPRFFHSPTTFAGRNALRWSAHVLGSIVPLCVLLACLPETLVGELRVHLIVVGFFTVLINMAMIGSRVRETNPARDRLRRFGPLFAGMSRLDSVLLESGTESPALREIAATFEELRPRIGKLERYVALLGFHEFGVIFEILNVVLLWELRVLPPAETIFRDHRELLERSTGALGEIEALCSLSCALDEQIGYSIPQPVEGDRPRIRASQLGHPLLESDVVVRNDLEIGIGSTEDISVIILSGSNMSGKSTYLKSAGLNVLLAGAGGAVCAESFEWTPMRLYSDINVRDSLDDGKSYFQVEVERVRDTIRAADENPMMLAIFDELFRGTNTDERVALGRSIVRHYRNSGALLLVATHDNALTELVTEDREPGIENYHLREDVREGEMTFDYRLRRGPATTRNAIRVLEVSGYPDSITTDARADLARGQAEAAEPENSAES